MRSLSAVLFDDTFGSFKSRVRAALVHLGLSVTTAVAIAVLVFAFWYPYPYDRISGGRDLFILVISVDVVLGPLLTLTVFNIRKPRGELRRDITVIALLQLAGLLYGLWTVQLARPVHLVFEIDRFRVVHRIEVPGDLADRTPPGIAMAPWTGPTPLSTRPFRDENERLELTLAALQGVHLGARPDLWEPYVDGRDRILQAARPLTDLRNRFPQYAAEIDKAVQPTGRQPWWLVYLPMVGRGAEAWTVLIDGRTAEIVTFVPLDSF